MCHLYILRLLLLAVALLGLVLWTAQQEPQSSLESIITPSIPSWAQTSSNDQPAIWFCTIMGPGGPNFFVLQSGTSKSLEKVQQHAWSFLQDIWLGNWGTFVAQRITDMTAGLYTPQHSTAPTTCIRNTHMNSQSRRLMNI